MEKIFSAVEKGTIENHEDPRPKILDSFEKIGFHEELNEEMIERLVLLEQESKFNEDARLVERGVSNVLDYLGERYSQLYPQFSLTNEQKAEGRVASILHDIGKTGPSDANRQGMKAIVRIFAQEQVNNPKISIGQVVKENFSSNEADEIIVQLENSGIDSRLTMRQFWDKHAEWTHDILEKFPSGLNKRVRIIAGSHHYNRGINPYLISRSEIPLQSNAIGLMEDYVDIIEERVLMAVDQYEANMRRSGSNHEKAIAWVRDNLDNLKNDKIINLICDAIDELGKRQVMFI